jgi:hypothetical protein
MKIRHMVVKDDSFGFEDTEIDPSKIRLFGFVNRSVKKRDGSFKKFYKEGFIRTLDGNYYKDVSKFYINELKQMFHGKYTVTKDTIMQYKKTRGGMATRTATDWTYTINKDVNHESHI